jgi:hypothetical protein
MHPRMGTRWTFFARMASMAVSHWSIRPGQEAVQYTLSTGTFAFVTR